MGKNEEAQKAYEAYLNFVPDDPEIKHTLISISDVEAPSRVPDECIQQLYQRFSAFYEDNMLEELGYEGPEHLYHEIQQDLGKRAGLTILDLGLRNWTCREEN